MVPLWDEYVEAITSRFGKLFDDPIAELFTLKQTGGVKEYHDSFDGVVSKLSLSEEYVLSCFLAGLSEEIQYQVRMFHPKNLQQAYCLAKLQEATQQAPKSKKHIKNTHNSQTRPPNSYRKPLPPLLPTPNTPPNNPKPPYPDNPPRPANPNFRPNTTRKTLTPLEMVDRRSKGLCCFCDDKFDPKHLCKGKRPQFYHLEVEEVEEYEEVEEPRDEPDTELAQISLNALSGVIAFQTFRVTGNYGKKPMQLLLDSGSTHNFLDINLAEKMGCIIQDSSPMMVKVVDGSKMLCDKWVQGFTWKLQGVDFCADVFLLSLGGCDMDLAIQWLSSLGPIIWDFNKLTMQLHYQGHKFLLRGAKLSRLAAIKAHQLDN